MRSYPCGAQVMKGYLYMESNTLLQRRDHYEYTEVPTERELLYALKCTVCGRSFENTDQQAKKCPRCLWKELSPC